MVKHSGSIVDIVLGKTMQCGVVDALEVLIDGKGRLTVRSSAVERGCIRT